MTDNLIAALEAAEGPEDEARLIERAWCVLRQNSTEDEDAHIAELLAMGAFLQVAMTMVPEGAFWSITMDGEGAWYHAACQATGEPMPDDLTWFTAAAIEAGEHTKGQAHD